MTMLITRDEVDPKNTWNLSAFYKNKELFEKDFLKFKGRDTAPFWPELQAFKGRLKEGPEVLLGALKTYFEISRGLDKIYTYSHLKHDEEITITENKEIHEKTQILLQHFQEESAWLEPEIFMIPETLLKSPVLESFHFHLEKLLSLKEHILSSREEELLALARRALQTPYKAFSSMNNADFKFPCVKDANNVEKELTHGSYYSYMQSRDRVLRENTFNTLHKQYATYENTLCNLIDGQMLSHQFNAKARNYKSSLEAALKPNNIDTSVYTSLIEAVRCEIGALHEYMHLRKKVLGVDTLHLYDMSVPLTKELDFHMEYEQAEQIVIESVAPLGKEYQEILKKGLNRDLWVDRYENKNKRSGAYSSGCFDSNPYILMNYKGLVRDVFTLTHECGHSMHSYFSRATQSYHYSNYSIFVAEVASTFNEELLSRYFLERVASKEEKIFFINSKIEDIRATLFRQTLFAEFELMIHTLVEENIPLTPALLKKEYRKLNEFYFGESVCIDDAIDIEWARIPHFYYDFYVYQYATGISAALALVDKVLKGSDQDLNNYLTFLKSGSSKYPIDTLKLAGVDMRSTTPVKAAIERFKTLVNELKLLTT
ncbi:MAG: oligoendopeptidase F [Chlamydiales bacterium]|nr:oligoendopeptidase F [Chlamydiales bacterium]